MILELCISSLYYSLAEQNGIPFMEGSRCGLHPKERKLFYVLIW